MVLLFELTNNWTTVIGAFLLFLGSVFTGIMAYLTFKKTAKIEKNTDGLVTTLIAGKEEASQAKQELSEATGKAAGIAEKQIEIDKMHKDLPTSNVSGSTKEDIVEKTKEAVKEKVEDIRPGDIVSKKGKNKP